MFTRIISASLSPNTERDDVVTAFFLLLQPWVWKNGIATSKAVDWFETKFSDSRAFAYNSGRSALYDILQSFGISTGDEVLLQAFTCVAVPNSVLWTGATPVYVDIDTSVNIDVNIIEKHITKKTKAIIVQHTLGIPANIIKIKAIAKKYSLLLIEDCAHALGAHHNTDALGSFGDAAFFSFGRDKVLSSVFGGMALIKNAHTDSIAYMMKREKNVSDAPMFWIFQQLLHPVLFSVVLPLYTSGIGKGILWIFQRLGLLSFPVYAMEKSGKMPSVFPSRYPNGLALLLLVQLKKLDRYVTHRRSIADYYVKALQKNSNVSLLSYPTGSAFLRLPILVKHPKHIISAAKKQGILIGNWYHNTIDPIGVDFNAVNYTKGSCPVAEDISTHVINLPTNITRAEATRVLSLFT